MCESVCVYIFMYSNVFLPARSMLLDRGANPVSEDNAMCSPEYHAVRNKHFDVVEHLRNFCSERADLLAEQTKAGTLVIDSLFSSDLSSVNSEGQTLLMVAVTHNHPNLVRKLLQMNGMSKHVKDFKDLQVCMCDMHACMQKREGVGLQWRM